MIAKSNSELFALKTLRSHGLGGAELSQVTRATLIAKLAYASPAWSGFCTAEDLSRLTAVERKARRWGLIGSSVSSISEIFDKADKELFSRILNVTHHSLRGLLPPIKKTGHELRPRGHPFELPRKSHLLAKNFITRMLYTQI